MVGALHSLLPKLKETVSATCKFPDTLSQVPNARRSFPIGTGICQRVSVHRDQKMPSTRPPPQVEASAWVGEENWRMICDFLWQLRRKRSEAESLPFCEFAADIISCQWPWRPWLLISGRRAASDSDIS